MPMETRKAAQRPQKRSFRASRKCNERGAEEKYESKRTLKCEKKSNTIRIP